MAAAVSGKPSGFSFAARPSAARNFGLASPSGGEKRGSGTVSRSTPQPVNVFGRMVPPILNDFMIFLFILVKMLTVNIYGHIKHCFLIMLEKNNEYQDWLLFVSRWFLKHEQTFGHEIGRSCLARGRIRGGSRPLPPDFRPISPSRPCQGLGKERFCRRKGPVANLSRLLSILAS
jgi:hypothetical protein